MNYFDYQTPAIVIWVMEYLQLDDEVKINVDRSFCGVGMMWRKFLNTCRTFRTYDSDRIVGLEINGSSISVLVLCPYLPFDCPDNYDDYMFYLSKILQIVEEFGSP